MTVVLLGLGRRSLAGADQYRGLVGATGVRGRGPDAQQLWSDSKVGSVALSVKSGAVPRCGCGAERMNRRPGDEACLVSSLYGCPWSSSGIRADLPITESATEPIFVSLDSERYP